MVKCSRETFVKTSVLRPTLSLTFPARCCVHCLVYLLHSRPRHADARWMSSCRNTALFRNSVCPLCPSMSEKTRLERARMGTLRAHSGLPSRCLSRPRPAAGFVDLQGQACTSRKDKVTSLPIHSVAADQPPGARTILRPGVPGRGGQIKVKLPKNDKRDS
jgi:hypothetical protein